MKNELIIYVIYSLLNLLTIINNNLNNPNLFNNNMGTCSSRKNTFKL